MPFPNTIWLLFVILFSSGTMAQDLDSFRWKNRILLLKDSHLNSEKLQEQLKVLHANPEKLDDRDILIFILADEVVYDTNKKRTKLQAAVLMTKYGLKDFQGLILLGKDGGNKLKQEFIVAPEVIFNLIDSMPMRQAEKKSSKNH